MPLSRIPLILAAVTALLPTLAGAQASEASLLRPGDAVNLLIWPDTELSGTYRVEEPGIVYLPVVGAVDVVGKTVQNLRAELHRRYSETMRNPVITVVPRFRVSVLGAVGAPGLYVVDPATTLLDVVSQAGGFAPNANAQEVRIIRGDRVIEVNAGAALESGGAIADLELRSGDRVVVPQSRRTVTLQAVQVALQVITMAITLVTLAR